MQIALSLGGIIPSFVCSLHWRLHPVLIFVFVIFNLEFSVPFVACEICTCFSCLLDTNAEHNTLNQRPSLVIKSSTISAHSVFFQEISQRLVRNQRNCLHILDAASLLNLQKLLNSSKVKLIKLPRDPLHRTVFSQRVEELCRFRFFAFSSSSSLSLFFFTKLVTRCLFQSGTYRTYLGQQRLD